MPAVDSVLGAQCQSIGWTTNTAYGPFGIVTGGSIDELPGRPPRGTIGGGSRQGYGLGVPTARLSYLPVAQTNSMQTIITRNSSGVVGNTLASPYGDGLPQRYLVDLDPGYAGSMRWPTSPLPTFDVLYAASGTDIDNSGGWFRVDLLDCKVDTLSLRCAMDSPLSVDMSLLATRYTLTDGLSEISNLQLTNENYEWYGSHTALYRFTPQETGIQSFELTIANNLRPVWYPHTCTSATPLGPSWILEGNQEIRLSVETALPISQLRAPRFSNQDPWTFTFSNAVPFVFDTGLATNDDFSNGAQRVLEIRLSNLNLVRGGRTILAGSGLLGYSYEFETPVNDINALVITNGLVAPA